jgi:DNA-binding NarL/FixJ family response regulator
MIKLRILLAEDQSMIRDGLKMLVNAQPDMEVISEVADSMKTVEQSKELQPDVVILDTSLPQIEGIRVTQEIKLCCPDIKVLALSIFQDNVHLHELLNAGVSGYILKQATGSDLINAIRVAVGGGVYLDLAMNGSSDQKATRRQARGRGKRENALSSREAEIVRLISQGYSNKEIAAQLSISVKTVETYKARAMDKLGLHSRSELVRYAWRNGWLTNPDG